MNCFFNAQRLAIRIACYTVIVCCL